MQLGRMRYRVQIQLYFSRKDKDGFVEKSWKTVTTIWADIVPLSAKEFISQGTETEEVTYKIYIRYREGITSDMRIMWGNHIFEIVSVLGDKRRGIIMLMVKEVV